MLKKILGVILGISLSLPSWPKDVSAQEFSKYPTNLDLIERAAKEAIEKMMMEIPLSFELPQEGISLKPEKVEEGGWLVENILTSILKEKEGKVILKDEERSEKSPRLCLSYRLVELGVNYGKDSHHLFGSKKIKRYAKAKIILRLIKEPEGEILFLKSGEGKTEDVVPQRILSYLEKGSFSLTNPTVKEDSGWSEVLEPLIVVGIVSGLIYLFYSTKATK
ncbi:MAG: hypothetical protein AB1393_05260 [Candidatus Edwardsbacteria bacterium]